MKNSTHYENGPTFKETFKDKKYHLNPLEKSSYFVAVDSDGNKLVGAYAPESHFKSTIDDLASKEGVDRIHVYEQIYEYRQTLNASVYKNPITHEI